MSCATRLTVNFDLATRFAGITVLGGAQTCRTFSKRTLESMRRSPETAVPSWWSIHVRQSTDRHVPELEFEFPGAGIEQTLSGVDPPTEVWRRRT